MRICGNFQDASALGEISHSRDRLLHERERECQDQFDSGLRQNLYGDERDKNVHETVKRAQKLELIHKLAESRRDRRQWKTLCSHEESEPFEKVRASNPDDTHTQLDETFAAIQTSMHNIESRFDRSGKFKLPQIARQTQQAEQQLAKQQSRWNRPQNNIQTSCKA